MQPNNEDKVCENCMPSYCYPAPMLNLELNYSDTILLTVALKHALKDYKGSLKDRMKYLCDKIEGLKV